MQTPLQTPIQTPLPGTADIYNIPTGPTDYPTSGSETPSGGSGAGGGGGGGGGNTDMKGGRPSPYMVNSRWFALIQCVFSLRKGSIFVILLYEYMLLFLFFFLNCKNGTGT